MLQLRQSHKRRTKHVEVLEPRVLLAGDVLITEFVASNDSTLDDRDGDSSDWLELFNDSEAPINLDGWFLTDDLSERDKWRLPAVTIEPGEYKVVFASDKNRANASAELHTSFKLSASGESLALIEPNRRTVAHAYDPFPRQFTDVSYGLRSETVTAELITDSSNSRVLIPTTESDLPTDVWTAIDFDDSNWVTRNGGIGFSGGEYDYLIGEAGRLDEMQDVSASTYVRIPFEINDPVSSYDQLELAVNYDDGFVAFLNGTPVAIRNAPDSLDGLSNATGKNGGVQANVTLDLLRAANALTLVGDAEWNEGRLRLTRSEPTDSAAVWTTSPLPFGPRFSFSASMQIDVTDPGGQIDGDGEGGHGMAFVLQSGGQFRLGGDGGALGLDGTGMQFVAVEFDTRSDGAFDVGAELPTHVGISSSVEGNVQRVAVPRFNGSTDSDPRFVWVDYDGVTDQFDVYFSSDAQKPAEPTVSATVDLQAVFEDSTSLWAGWTAATGEDAWNTHEVTDFEISTSSELGHEQEIIDISEFVTALQPGENTLAVHGLNFSRSDDDFLFKARLTSRQSNRFDLSSPGYFAEPTPGEQNSEATAAPSGEVSYSVTGRTFVEPFDLAIRAVSPAEIRYTTDGSIPDETSTLYRGPIRVGDSMRIRARAFEPNKSAGPINSQGYIQLASDLVEFEGGVFESNLPLMVFHSYGGNVHANATNLVPVSSVFIENSDGRANLLGEPEFAGRAGLRIRGQSSQGWPKKQYALEIWEEGNSDTRPIAARRADDRAVSIFGLPAESDWVLNGPYSDKTQLNNYLTFNWSNAMGQYAPRTRLVEVFVKTGTGALNYRTDYRGTYVLLEKIKIDGDRVDIVELAPGVTEEPAISGGYIWKYDKNGVGDVNFTSSFQSRTGSGRPWKFVEPQRPPREQREWLEDHLRDFERALYGSRFTDPQRGYAQYIDVDSWVDTWLLVEFTKNIDGFRLSTYYHKDRGGKIKQGPAWDYNLSLANSNYLRGAYPAGWYHSGLSRGDYPYWDRLFEDPNFEIRVRDRWFELRASIFSTTSLLADVDEAVGLLTDNNPNLGDLSPGEPSNPISRNFNRWRTLNTYLWPNCFFGSGDCPSSPLPNRSRPSSYGDYVFILKDFIQERAAWIDRQFRSPPEIWPQGGVVGVPVEVVLNETSGGTVYYTLDGSDPRDPSTGELSESAVEYTEPFQVSENTVVQSRSLRRQSWSAKSTKTYFVDIPTITVSELNYNPTTPSRSELAAGYSDNDDFEFFELVNFGDQPIDLEGMRFTEGVEFVMPDAVVDPGERVVAVRNEAAFRFRNGESARVVGQYGHAEDEALDFKLRNSGERLVMFGALGEPILDFAYEDDWFPLSDGEGFSLVRRTPINSNDAGQRNAWRASEFIGGSPGSSETGVVPAPDELFINEVLSSSDGHVVELFNPTDRSISVGHFYLSDDEDEPRKFRLPPNAEIDANGFLLLDRQTLGPGFRLNAAGSQLTLRGALADRTLTGFLQTVEFGPTDSGQSWGRVETTVGSDFAPLTSATPNADNAPPRVGPIVINEVQYHPKDDQREFIELKNISSGAVDLTGWQFDRGIRFAFPDGAELAAGGYLVLIQVEEDELVAEQISLFRTTQNLPELTAVFAYRESDGSLDNAGETLVLKRPDSESNRLIEADRVVYSDEEPWNPRADGQGPSLSRINSNSFGNDPANWKTSTQQGTPGRGNRFEDATPPTTPRNLASLILDGGAVGLGWSPSLDAESSVQYFVIRNGVLIGTTPIAFYRDEEVTWKEGQSVSYQVVAQNPDGFESEPSNRVTVSVDSTSFQDGVAGYAGTLDTAIKESERDASFGTDSRLVLDGNAVGESDRGDSALIRWSEISVPRDTSVVGASVSVSVLRDGDVFDIKPILKHWEFGEVTWNQAANGQPWEIPGGTGSNDVGARIGSLVTSGREFLTVSLNRLGVEVVQSWVEEPANNHGIIFSDPGSSSNSVTIESRLGRTDTSRPKLTIFHVPQAEGIDGDFNFDGVANSHDINVLHAALREGVVDAIFDLDGNSAVDREDVDYLLENIIGTVGGDTDLNGRVDFADFLLFSHAFLREEEKTWESGDFDGDGEATFADFLLLSNNFGVSK